MKKLLIFALLACVLAMSAVAATVEFDIQTTEEIQDYYGIEYDDIYSFKATVNSEGGTFTGCEIVFKYDNTLFVPVEEPIESDNGSDELTDVDISENPEFPVQPTITRVRSNYRFNFAARNATKYVVDGNMTQVTVSFYDTERYPKAEDLPLFNFFFRYADGKGVEDIKADSFSVEYLQYDDYALNTSFATDERYGLPNTVVISVPVNFLPEGGSEEPEINVDETWTTTEDKFIDVCPVYKTNFATPADEYGFIGALATIEDTAFVFGAEGVIFGAVEATEAGEYTVIVKGVPSGESVKVRPYYCVEGKYFYGAVVEYTAA